MEEKKLLNQKSQQKNNQQRNELHKTAALAFIKQKKEEIRMRTEQEAKELLDKKHKKDQLESAVPKPAAAIKKPNAKTATTATPHSTAKQDRNVVANKPSSAVSKNMPNANVKSVATAASSKAKPNEIKKPPSLPQTSGKTNLKKPNPPATVNSQNQMKKIPKLSDSGPKPPAMSYDQMLKIADTFYKDKLTKTDNPKPEFKRADFSQIPLNGSSKNKKINETAGVVAAAVIKKNVAAVDAIKKQQQLNPTTSNNQARKPIDTAKSTSHPNAAVKSQKPQQVPRSIPAASNLDTSKGMSSWDRIISDMKKKPVKNNVKSKL